MKVVYIAGPFRAPTAWGIAENVRAAERAGIEVARLGAMPLIPHANTANFHGELSDQFWLDGTLELLRRCDALLLIDGWVVSSGARKERAEAAELSLPIFQGPEALEALKAWLMKPPRELDDEAFGKTQAELFDEGVIPEGGAS